MALHEKHRQWFEARGLSVDLAEKMGLDTVMKDGAAWLAVPYVENGKTVNHKYRLTSEKRFQLDKGGRLTLWNHDCLLRDTDKPVVICEGEMDAMVAISLGWRAVSVPNGASGAGKGSGAYEYLWNCQDAINKNKKFILATDGDEPGLALRADLVALLGADRCAFIEYPLGLNSKPLKDLNEVLLDFGVEGVATILNSAKDYPVKGLYKIADFPRRGPLVELPLGVRPLNGMLSIVPGTLTVFTGYANMGKSTAVDSLVAELIRYNIPVCLASFETEVNPILIDALRCSLLRCGTDALRNCDTAEVDGTINDNLSIISQLVDEDDEMDLEYFLTLCRTAVERDGAKVVILDPWNELEHKRRRDETETEYISRALRAIKKFAKQNDVAFWIVAHPTKPHEGSNKVPKLYDISGSANWANKADYGLTYHRPDPTQNFAEFHVCKVRKGLPGRKGKVATSFDFRTHEFVEAVA